MTNIGVIVGLVLVAYEVRQATLQANAEATHAMSTELQDSRKELALSPDLADMYVKVNTSGVGSLAPIE